MILYRPWVFSCDLRMLCSGGRYLSSRNNYLVSMTHRISRVRFSIRSRKLRAVRPSSMYFFWVVNLNKNRSAGKNWKKKALDFKRKIFLELLASILLKNFEIRPLAVLCSKTEIPRIPRRRPNLSRCLPFTRNSFGGDSRKSSFRHQN